MNKWPSIEFPETIQKTKIGRENQVLSSDIAAIGRFPVVDQGQAFIAGYSDAEDRVIRDDLPLVVFGDHTRCLKYVDFPFILGADGTKVLKPKEDLFDAKFFYYALLSIDIPNRGYNRHFTILKERKVPRPEKDEQRKIAGVLGVVQRAMEQQERLIALTTELKKALLHQLFTQGLRGEPQKQTEIGPVPESWEVVPIREAYKFTKKPRGLKIEDEDLVPFLPMDTIPIGRIYVSGFEERLGSALSSGTYIENGDLLVAKITPSFENGKQAIVDWKRPFGFATTEVLPIQEREGISDKHFLFHILLHPAVRSDLAGKMDGTTGRQRLSKEVLGARLIPLPPISEQREIASMLNMFCKKQEVHECKRAALTALFRTLLHQLMTAQLRVHDLDLPEVDDE